MFTKVHLQNFRSFGDFTLDLMTKNSEPRNLAIIYGENGAGKSNLMSSFVLLQELLSTMDVRDMYAEFLNQKAIFADENMENIMRSEILSGIRDMEAIIKDIRMVGNNKPILAEYDFDIHGNSGTYTVIFGEKEIIYEKLEYLLTKRRGTYFECTQSKITVNSALTKDKALLKDIKDSAKKFWGKHSIFAIIDHELKDKAIAYGEDNISQNFYDVFGMLHVLSCYTGLGEKTWDKLCAPLLVLKRAIRGRIPVSKESQLDMVERIFSTFFTAINSDIRRVFYRRNYNGQNVEYELMFEKLIAGEYRFIEFSRESSGNHQLVRILCYLISACFWGISVIDEADSGIHDYLFLKILKEIQSHISGQVIMTSHNTMLMEAEFSRDSTYILSEDECGNKVVKAVNSYDKRTYLNNNVRNKYMNNEYGGLPQVKSINFNSIMEDINAALNT